MFLALLSFAGFTRRQVDTMGIKAFVKLQQIYKRIHTLQINVGSLSYVILSIGYIPRSSNGESYVIYI